MVSQTIGLKVVPNARHSAAVFWNDLLRSEYVLAAYRSSFAAEATMSCRWGAVTARSNVAGSPSDHVGMTNIGWASLRMHVARSGRQQETTFLQFWLNESENLSETKYDVSEFVVSRRAVTTSFTTSSVVGFGVKYAIT